MRKTNVQIDGEYLIKEGSKYLISHITDYEGWRNLEDLSEYTDTEDVTGLYSDLSKKYGIKSNVNFIVSDFKKFKKSLEGDEVKVVDLKKSGSKKGGSPKLS